LFVAVELLFYFSVSIHFNCKQQRRRVPSFEPKRLGSDRRAGILLLLLLNEWPCLLLPAPRIIIFRPLFPLSSNKKGEKRRKYCNESPCIGGDGADEKGKGCLAAVAGVATSQPIIAFWRLLLLPPSAARKGQLPRLTPRRRTPRAGWLHSSSAQRRAPSFLSETRKLL